ncbi:hypothetical protein A0O28_0049260 [Trichoderma guizhouense]|uniref:Peptidase A2 domain-containing protein n=1 Tax=Trichoderma guizhouense TaxID=1491466 RepID=A0A1T3CDP8_9HYPO|nr:hypothetical protein A0O28_0049260 [Trichoderma guizhouense]
MTKRDFALENTQQDVSSPEKRWKKDIDNVQTPLRKLKPDDYTVGWICAITVEYVAAQEFLDEEHEGPKNVSPHDNNNYTLGSIGEHNVVIATLPLGEYGIASAATVARDMMHSFPNVRIGLMVGIGGGAPSEQHDIRLGDIVVSAPKNGNGGLLQYDFGKNIQDQEFLATGFLNQPPVALRTALAGLQAQYERKGHRIEEAVNSVFEKNKRLRRQYKKPDQSSDRLYPTGVVHPNTKENCVLTCDESKLIVRPERDEDEDNPAIHYGLIASANQLMKNALLRDKLAAEKDVLCFEMEAAGLMNHFPCLIIRGICDYSDSHKNKEWQGYAAMVAAAYAKDLLYRIAPNSVTAEKRIIDVLSGLLDGVFDLQTKTGVNILATSRFSESIKKQFDGCPTVEISATDGDILTYLNGQISLRRSNMINGALQGKISTQLTKASGGMFLLAMFHIKEIMEQPTIGDIEDVLQKLGSGMEGLNELYKQAIKRINDHPEVTKRLAKRILIWITRAQRPLSIVEIRHALSVREKMLKFDLKYMPDMEFLTSVCAGLVTIDESSEIIRLVHYTTQEFLQQTHEEWFPQGELYMTKVCATYLSFDTFENGPCQTGDELKERLDSNPLYHYAAHNWGHHARAAATISQQVIDLLECKAKMEAASQILMAVRPLKSSDLLSRFIERIPRELTRLHLAAYFGVETAVGHFLRKGDNPDLKDTYGRTPLSWAAENGHVAVVALLLKTGQVDAGSEDKWNQTPLLYASANNHEGIVELLLENGVNVDSKNIDMDADAKIIGAYSGRTPLLYASANDYVTIVKLLLEKGASIDTRDMDGKTALAFAAEGGHERTVQLLLDNGADVNIRDNQDWTPLSWAVSKGHEALVRLLLNRGTTIQPDDHHLTELSWAIQHEDKLRIEILLRRGYHLEGSDVYTQTPLVSAIKENEIIAAELLFDTGADPNLRGSDERAPLSWAVELGHSAIVQLLLDKGADPNVKDSTKRTPLSVAAEKGYTDIVQLLLDKGADPNVEDFDKRTPLSVAAERGHATIFQLLLDKGVDPTLEGPDKRTPLSLAVEMGRVAIIQLLLDKGVEISYEDTDVSSLLLNAAEKGCIDIIQHILNKDAQCETSDLIMLDSLFQAVEMGHAAIVQLLLDRGADISHEATDFSVFPSNAFTERSMVIVQQILDNDLQIGASAVVVPALLLLAVEMGHTAIVELLLDRAAEIGLRNRQLWVPLLSGAIEVATEFNHIVIVQLLIEHGHYI